LRTRFAAFGLRVGAAFFGVMLFAAVLSPAFAVNNGLRFDGSPDNDYVTFGADTLYLGLQRFTLEVWFFRTGAGVTTSTGTGGVTSAIPLLTKGRGEADAADRRDMNYFLGIRSTDNVLCADYEEGRGQLQPSLNHPVVGVTPILYNTWYHAAVTFDGTKLQLFLNGNLEAEVTGLAGRLPRWDSSQHAGLATGLTSTGVAAGYFAGVLDEARVWNRARTQAAIADSMGLELTSAPGLRGRWGLNETSGTTAFNSVASSPNGTLTGSPAWVPGFPHSLKFGSSNAYVTFRNPAQLGLETFTIETWFRRDGTGTAVSTGSLGVTALPLVTHGSAEYDGDQRDMNYFLGIRASDNVLCADFEDVPAGTNHPVAGVTPIVNGAWYHAAATYDGTSWRLYLNGLLENELVVGQHPQHQTIQHAGLGTCIKSDSTANGFFNGTLDEVRIWNYARTQLQVDSTINAQIRTAKPGLVARWSLDEPVGSIVRSSPGATLPGSIKGSGSSWDAAAPFNIIIDLEPPDAPSGLSATAITYAEIDLGWIDNSTTALHFEIERSTSGLGGPFTPLATVSASVTSYADTYLDPDAEYCYRVRATNNNGFSDWSNVPCETTPAETARALDFGASNGYVTFGRPSQLDLQQFTLECWFRRDGVGATANTGSGGFYAVPLVTKGRGQEDGDRRDMNYFLGIMGTDSVLCADFEDIPAGLNHPVVGVTPIHIGTWYHAAATYDGTTWRLYLNGMLENELTVGATPQWQSWQHAGLGAAMDTSGAASGHFDGRLDEVRIWSVARSQAEIQSTINAQISIPESNLTARWSLNENAGGTVFGSAGTAVTGTIKNTEWSWSGPAPFDLVINNRPDQPILVSPSDGGLGVLPAPTLDVMVSDPESNPLTVTYYGRGISTSPGAPFSIVMLPDAQYYTSELNEGSIATFRAQTQWIVDAMDSLNIVYVNQIGDISENGDSGLPQWEGGWTAMQTLEDPVATQLPEGLPYGVTVGNHDQTPNGNAAGTTTFYNAYYGAAHFAARPYYGGHFGSNSDNHFNLFGASGLDFLVISMEYDTAPDAPVLAWADSLLKAYPTRKGIICTHNLISAANPGVWSSQGQAIYNALRDNPNLLLMLCGHNMTEGRRVDTYGGNVVHTVLADYQGRPNGGDGWLRIMKFYPDENVIRVQTYSPTLDSLEADADSSSQFTLAADLLPLGGWATIGTASGVPSGSHATIVWPGLAPSSQYEWYVTVSDGNSGVAGPAWSFTTRSASPTAAVVYPNGREHLNIGASVDLRWTASDDVAVTSVDLLVSRDGAGGTYAPIATGLANTGTYAWTVDGAATTDAFLKVVAHDGDGSSGEDVSDAAFEIVVTTDVEGRTPTQLSFEIGSAHPFNGAGFFSLAVPRPSRVKLTVFDVSGRRVATIVDADYQPGRYRIAWKGNTAYGRAASGIYFMRLEACGKSLTRKVVMVR